MKNCNYLSFEVLYVKFSISNKIHLINTNLISFRKIKLSIFVNEKAII